MGYETILIGTIASEHRRVQRAAGETVACCTGRPCFGAGYTGAAYGAANPAACDRNTDRSLASNVCGYTQLRAYTYRTVRPA